MELFLAENIVKDFANHRALNNVSITVPESSIYGLLGPNGAGKTTLIRIINQITAPDDGSLFFNGRKLTSKDIYQIGYLPEERGLYKKMKVGEQAVYLAQLKGLSKKEANTRLKHWFKKFDIINWWDKKVEELSKGMQQKIQFVVTVIHEPKLIIFDEPFSGFDPINADMLKNEILELRDKGATIIFSTHNMGSVEELCDRITLIHNAKTILEGPIQKVREQYKSNTYEISFKGNEEKLPALLNEKYEVKGMLQENGLHKVQIQVMDECTENDLIKRLIQEYVIVSFKEVLPSMNDVFIKAVKNLHN